MSIGTPVETKKIPIGEPFYMSDSRRKSACSVRTAGMRDRMRSFANVLYSQPRQTARTKLAIDRVGEQCQVTNIG
jgi:hypothetical protein